MSYTSNLILGYNGELIMIHPVNVPPFMHGLKCAFESMRRMSTALYQECKEWKTIHELTVLAQIAYWYGDLNSDRLFVRGVCLMSYIDFNSYSNPYGRTDPFHAKWANVKDKFGPVADPFVLQGPNRKSSKSNYGGLDARISVFLPWATISDSCIYDVRTSGVLHGVPFGSVVDASVRDGKSEESTEDVMKAIFHYISGEVSR